VGASLFQPTRWWRWEQPFFLLFFLFSFFAGLLVYFAIFFALNEVSFIEWVAQKVNFVQPPHLSYSRHFNMVSGRVVKKNWGTGTGTGKPGNRKPGSRFRFRFEKTKNRIPRFRCSVFGTRFLPGYRESG
jgi:hypothetical protein